MCRKQKGKMKFYNDLNNSIENLILCFCFRRIDNFEITIQTYRVSRMKSETGLAKRWMTLFLNN